jgi:cell division transport system ATP-binding protein
MQMSRDMERITPKSPIIDFSKVSKIYPPDVIALRDVSFAVHPGETLFLTGMSGAGKSTLLKLICAIERPSKGIVEVAGHDLSKVSATQLQAIRQQMGVAYQDFKLLPRQSVAHNIAMAMEVTYTPKKTIHDRISFLLDALGLTPKKDVRLDRLSQGEQQRVAVARAAANYPPLLLADEPTGNLDPTSTGLVLKLFEQLRRAGTTLVIATHDHRLYLNTSHKVLELAQGRIKSHQPANQDKPGESS